MDFERLCEGVINDFQPEGETQKHCAGMIATSLWAQRRVARFGQRELLLAQTSPAEEEAELFADLILPLLNARNETVAKACLRALPERYRQYIEREFPRANYSDLQTWTSALGHSAVPTIQSIIWNGMLLEQRDLALQTRQAERVRAVLEKLLTLQKRGQASALKAIKAMLELKAWMGSTIPRKPDPT